MATTQEELKRKILEILESRQESFGIDDFLLEVRSVVISPRRLFEAMAELERSGAISFDGREIHLVHEHA